MTFQRFLAWEYMCLHYESQFATLYLRGHTYTAVQGIFEVITLFAERWLGPVKLLQMYDIWPSFFYKGCWLYQCSRSIESGLTYF